MSIDKFKGQWMPISDMMTGLMMVFLFIAVSYAHSLKKESESAIEKQDDIEEIVQRWIDYRNIIARDLHDEFDNDLEIWDATIDDDTLSIRFESPEVLFGAGDDTVSPLFETIISDFWPRYIGVLNRHSINIDEIKIEGHTSSEWSGITTHEESYFNNMQLSQNRSRNVLQLCYQKTPESLKKWVISTITANGFSFSRLKYDEKGNEDMESSRRVEFTILVDSESSINEISETL